jgi:23S rRNA pseudouridine1911/1915/1917 synthase
MKKIKIQENENIRLDNYLLDFLELSRSQIQKNIKAGLILVNNEIVKTGYILKADDEITLLDIVEDRDLFIYEKLDLDILYEDEDIIVINKPTNLVTHPALGTNEVTLVSALIANDIKLSKSDDENRPGVVHRLDKDTTGAIILTKTNKAYELFKLMFQNKEIHRTYHLITNGVIKEDEGIIEAPIARDKKDRTRQSIANDGREAITKFRVLERFQNNTYVEAKLLTGRTHQIRVHFKYINYPVLGDPVYGLKNNQSGQYLHAYKLQFYHPIQKRQMELIAPLPNRFLKMLNSLK